MNIMLESCRTLADLGSAIVPGLYPTEADYLMTHEWVASAADILRRRSKLGLHLPAGSAQKLDAWIAGRALAQRVRPQAGAYVR